jgi:hypothetical protein
MKKKIAVVLMLAVAVSAAAQAPHPVRPDRTQVTGHTMSPSYSHQYCAGFITNQSISRANFVAAGMESPHATRFSTGDIVFLSGDVMQEGAQYMVLRHSKDSNENEIFYGQRAAIAALGQVYAELGRVRVLGMQSGYAVAQVEFSCDAIVPGDLLVPFAEKPQVTVPPVTSFNRFHLPAPRVSARLVMAQDFAMITGTGQIVYLSAGADRGVAVGDIFRAVRGHELGPVEEAESLSAKAPADEPTQVKSAQRFSSLPLPRRILGEMVVIHVTSTSSTAMITKSLETINVGDAVEIH